MSSQPARHFTTQLWQELPQNLSICWFAVASLYFLDVPILPEPSVALVASTSVGLVAAVMKSTSTAEPRFDASTARSAWDQQRAPDRTLLPSPLMPSPWTDVRTTVPPSNVQTGSSRVHELPAAAGALQSDRSDARIRRNAESANPACQELEPSPEPLPMPAPPAAITVRQMKLDLDAYASADVGELQCPSCGSFAVTVDETSSTARGTICRHEWSLPAGDSLPLDVIVRSWFSP